MHDDELGDKRDSSRAVGEMEHEEQNKQAEYTRVCVLVTNQWPRLCREGIICQASAACHATFLSVPREPVRLSSRLKMTSQGEAPAGPRCRAHLTFK